MSLRNVNLSCARLWMRRIRRASARADVSASPSDVERLNHCGILNVEQGILNVEWPHNLRTSTFNILHSIFNIQVFRPSIPDLQT